MTILEAKRETRLAVWQQHIQDQRSSGLTVRAWCAQNGCSEKSYYYWLKLVRERMLEQAAESTLVQVRLEELVSASSTETGRSHQGAVLGRYGIHSAVQAPDGKAVPVAAKRSGAEKAY